MTGRRSGDTRGGNGEGEIDGGYGLDSEWRLETSRLSNNHIALQREFYSLVADERQCKQNTHDRLDTVLKEIARLNTAIAHYAMKQEELHLDVQMIAACLQKGLGK